IDGPTRVAAIRGTMLHFVQRLALWLMFGALATSPAWSQTAFPTPQPGKAVLHLSAVLSGQTDPLRGGLHWRVYPARAEQDGGRALLAESQAAQPTFTLPPGDYVV